MRNTNVDAWRRCTKLASNMMVRWDELALADASPRRCPASSARSAKSRTARCERNDRLQVRRVVRSVDRSMCKLFDTHCITRRASRTTTRPSSPCAVRTSRARTDQLLTLNQGRQSEPRDPDRPRFRFLLRLRSDTRGEQLESQAWVVVRVAGFGARAFESRR